MPTAQEIAAQQQRAAQAAQAAKAAQQQTARLTGSGSTATGR